MENEDIYYHISSTRIVSLDFKPNSLNTLELYLDNKRQFTFRIHNASSEVETSLKFGYSNCRNANFNNFNRF